VEKAQETQIDADILQCRADILRAHQAVTATVKEEASDAATATTTHVKPTEKNPVKAGAADKGEELTKNAIKSGPEPQLKEVGAAPVELSGQQTQNQMEQEAKMSAQKAEAEAKVANEMAEQEAAARAEALEKVKAEQELKAAAQMAQAEAKAARIKAQAEAKAAAQKAEQEVKARMEAEEKLKAESEARAKAEAEAKALAEKARQDATARAEAERKAKAEADARAKAEQEVKALVENIQARTESKTAPEASGPSSRDEKENVKAPGTIFQGEEGKDTENRIPRFNLAQQILAEQRRAASVRRGRPTERSGSGEIMPATGTIGRIIREAKKKTTDAGEDDKTLQQLSCGVHGIVEGAHNLNPAQRQVIAGIVTLDIARLSSEEVARREARPG